MTNFTKQNLIKNSEYVMYTPPGAGPYSPDAQFVARFKYQRGAIGSFITFLTKNFTVEEYFSRMENGESPLKIAESKGYILPHIKRWMKEAGFAPIPANLEAYRKHYSAQLDAAMAAAKARADIKFIQEQC